MTKQPTIRALDSLIYSHAAKIVERDKRHCPFLLSFAHPAPSVNGVVGCDITNRQDDIDRLTEEFFERDANVFVVVLIAEAWMLTLNHEQYLQLREDGESATTHPNRKEVILVSFTLRSGIRYIVGHPIVRTEGGAPQLARGEMCVTEADPPGTSYALH